MFSRVRIAIRFFFVGLAVGVLLAPRSGEETRRIVRDKADRLLNDVLDAATLGTYESGAARPTTVATRPMPAPRRASLAARPPPALDRRRAPAPEAPGAASPALTDALAAPPAAAREQPVTGH